MKGGYFMKAKNILIALSVIVGFFAMLLGVAIVVDKVLKKRECYEGYIECDCTEDEIAE